MANRKHYSINPLTGLFDETDIGAVFGSLSATAPIDFDSGTGVISYIPDTPFTFTYFDSAGLPQDLPNWVVQAWYGPSSNLSLNTPTDAGDVYPGIHRHEIEITAAQNTVQYHPSAFLLDFHFDRSNGGADTADVRGLDVNATVEGSGTLGVHTAARIFQGLTGDGVGGDTTTAYGLELILNSQASYTIGNASQFRILSDTPGTSLSGELRQTDIFASGIVDSYNGFTLNNSAITNTFSNLLTLISSNTVGTNFNGLGVYNNSDVLGGANLATLGNQSDITGTLNLLNLYNNNDITGYFTFINGFSSGDLLGNASAINLNFSGDVTGNLSGIGIFSNGSIGSGYTGFISGLNNSSVITGSAIAYNAFFNGSVTGQVYGLNVFNDATADSYAGAIVSNVAAVTEQRLGYRADLQGSSRTTTALDVFVTGNTTDDVQGLRISIDTATSTNQRVRSFDINGATYSTNGQYAPQSGLFVDNANNDFLAFTVASGSPVTGTDVLVNSAISAYLVQDDVALGPVGLGLVTRPAISLVGIATGKTVDLIRGQLTVASIQNPGFADAGTLDRFEGIVFAGSLPSGGSTVVNTSIGLYMPAGFDSYAGANWGILVDGSTAENYLNRLAINTAGKVVTSATYRLDVGGAIHSTDYYSSPGNQGATATVSGLVFENGLYISGSVSSVGNLDGGDADSIYGGTSPIDGGGA